MLNVIDRTQKCLQDNVAYYTTYRHVFNINAPYVNENPISRNQTRAVHV